MLLNPKTNSESVMLVMMMISLMITNIKLSHLMFPQSSEARILIATISQIIKWRQKG